MLFSFKKLNMFLKYFLNAPIFIALLIMVSCDSPYKNQPKKNETITIAKKPVDHISTPSLAGTYAFGDNIEKGPVGSVMIYPLLDNSVLFFLDICNGAPSYNLGQLFGQMTIKDNIGTYNANVNGGDFNCILKFKFTSEELIITTEPGHNDCGFGNNVFADHLYKHIQKTTPRHFINAEGDTILFNGLTVEKYNHRFD
jgi:hypothetical protein